ncbi:hypothetical protein B0H13DRAFT_2371493 [Mycena leptocephala]|nr:hypothetical protein B0H13DRAFT_2371493 [Mycena leptocephala]
MRHDFATRPTVTQVYVKAKGDMTTSGMRKPFLVCPFPALSGPFKGIVTVCLVKNTPLMTFRQDEIDRYGGDAVAAMKWNAAFAPDGTKIGRWLNNAYFLGKLKYYHGLDATREGLRLHAAVRLRENP